MNKKIKLASFLLCAGLFFVSETALGSSEKKNENEEEIKIKEIQELDDNVTEINIFKKKNYDNNPITLFNSSNSLNGGGAKNFFSLNLGNKKKKKKMKKK